MARGLGGLKNIGPAIAGRLRSIGIETPEQLAQVGAVEAWRRISRANPGATVPVCYYLYSIEGALRGVYWNDLPDALKSRLLQEAQVKETRAAR